MHKRKQTNIIVLHCTATKEGKDFKAKDIKAWHLQDGWEDIGYHYVIDLDGKIEKGRDEELVGAHCQGRNFDSIGIVYVGGLSQSGLPKDTRTLQQAESMYELVDGLLIKYGLDLSNVHCHNEFTHKYCPCFSILEFKYGYLNWKKKQDHRE